MTNRRRLPAPVRHLMELMVVVSLLVFFVSLAEPRIQDNTRSTTHVATPETGATLSKLARRRKSSLELIRIEADHDEQQQNKDGLAPDDETNRGGRGFLDNVNEVLRHKQIQLLKHRNSVLPHVERHDRRPAGSRNDRASWLEAINQRNQKKQLDTMAAAMSDSETATFFRQSTQSLSMSLDSNFDSRDLDLVLLQSYGLSLSMSLDVRVVDVALRSAGLSMSLDYTRDVDLAFLEARNMPQLSSLSMSIDDGASASSKALLKQLEFAMSMPTTSPPALPSVAPSSYSSPLPTTSSPSIAPTVTTSPSLSYVPTSPTSAPSSVPTTTETVNSETPSFLPAPSEPVAPILPTPSVGPSSNITGTPTVSPAPTRTPRPSMNDTYLPSLAPTTEDLAPTSGPLPQPVMPDRTLSPTVAPTDFPSGAIHLPLFLETTLATTTLLYLLS